MDLLKVFSCFFLFRLLNSAVESQFLLHIVNVMSDLVPYNMNPFLS